MRSGGLCRDDLYPRCAYGLGLAAGCVRWCSRFTGLLTKFGLPGAGGGPIRDGGVRSPADPLTLAVPTDSLGRCTSSKASSSPTTRLRQPSPLHFVHAAAEFFRRDRRPPVDLARRRDPHSFRQTRGRHHRRKTPNCGLSAGQSSCWTLPAAAGPDNRNDRRATSYRSQRPVIPRHRRCGRGRHATLQSVRHQSPIAVQLGLPRTGNHTPIHAGNPHNVPLCAIVAT